MCYKRLKTVIYGEVKFVIEDECACCHTLTAITHGNNHEKDLLAEKQIQYLFFGIVDATWLLFWRFSGQ